MKKLILAAVAVGVVGLSVPSAHAGDREWATVGKVLTGVAAGVIIAKSVNCAPSYTSVSYGYGAPNYSVSYTVSSAPPCPPPPRVVCAPAPLFCAPAPVVYYAPPVCEPPTYPVTYGHPGRGHAWGHHKPNKHCRW